MWDFCFDLCRWTSTPPPPHRLIHRGLWEHSAPVLRNHEPFFFVWNVDCYQEGAAQRGTPFTETRQGDFILSPRKRLMTGFSAFFQCDGTKTQEWLGVQMFVEAWRLGKKTKPSACLDFVHLIFFIFYLLRCLFLFPANGNTTLLFHRLLKFLLSFHAT